MHYTVKWKESPQVKCTRHSFFLSSFWLLMLTGKGISGRVCPCLSYSNPVLPKHKGISWWKVLRVFHLDEKCYWISSWFPLFPIKDGKFTHFLIQNPTCFPRFPPTTNTNTDIYQQNRSCWKDFFGCWNGLLSPGHGRLFSVLSPSPSPSSPKSFMWSVFPDMWCPIIFLPFGSAATHKSILFPGLFKLVLQTPQALHFLKGMS